MKLPRSLALVLVVTVGVAVVGACGGDDDDAGSGDADDVIDVVWQLTELDGEPVPDGVNPTLEFDGSRISGTGGCNTYGADATFESGTVTISSQIISTMMACEPEASEVEATMLQVLPTVDTFEVTGDTLTLSVGDDPVLVFSSS